MKDLKTVINAYFNFYNTARFHQSLDYNVPDEMYKCFQYNELERKRAASPVERKKSAAQNLGGTSGQFLDFFVSF